MFGQKKKTPSLPKAFALADRATESGHDLRLVCRELAGVIRDELNVKELRFATNEADDHCVRRQRR